MTQMKLAMKQKQTHRDREQSCVAKGERDGEGMEFGISRCKLLYTGWVNNKGFRVQQRELHSVSCD